MYVCVCVFIICKNYTYVSVTVPRVRHLVTCTHRVPPGKVMCFLWVLTGVSVLHPENCVWVLVCRWWQGKQFQVSQRDWRPKGSGFCIPWAQCWEQGEQSREREPQPLPTACRQGLAGERQPWVSQCHLLGKQRTSLWGTAPQSLLSHKNP